MQVSLLQRIAGMLVDLKLLQMDCLEGLAATLDEQAAAGAPQPSTKKKAKAGKAAASMPEEAAALLAEADALAAELVAE